MTQEVLTIPHGDLVRTGRALGRAPGVSHVTVDPIRGQLVVGYEQHITSAQHLRAIACAPEQRSTLAPRLLPWWPRLSALPGALAALA